MTGTASAAPDGTCRRKTKNAKFGRGEPPHRRVGRAFATVDLRRGTTLVTTYSRYASCTKGHGIKVRFRWDLDSYEDPADRSEPCPVPGCDGRVEFSLPIGAEGSSVRVTAVWAGEGA
jgi:hypothetical protein